MFRKLKHDAFVGLVKFLVRFSPSASYNLFAGENSSRHLCRHIATMGQKKLLVVTDKPLVEAGVVASATEGFSNSTVDIVVFDEVVPDPTFTVVKAGVEKYRREGCDGILAIGGGSSIDAAKVIGVGVSHPGDPKDYAGFGKVRQPLPPFYAIPTTSGTGSEATMGAVITDETTHAKLIVSGGTLLPVAAALDPLLLAGLPAHITAATGMDALTHAIEAYIGVWDRDDCQERALAAVRLIFGNLERCYQNGSDLEARDAMAYASYTAGRAVNLVNVGNVHAISHQVGAMCGVPHGLANAVFLPHVLELSLAGARTRLTELAKATGNDSAEGFIAAVKQLNHALDIPETLDALKQADISELAQRAINEADDYPVPYMMEAVEVENILRKVSNT